MKTGLEKPQYENLQSISIFNNHDSVIVAELLVTGIY